MTVEDMDDKGTSTYSDIKGISSDNPIPSTHSSTNKLHRNALSQLVDLFLYHGRLRPLCTLAISKVGPEIFKRTYRRLLLHYGRDLQNDASNSVELQAAKFVRRSARQIAAEITDL